MDERQYVGWEGQVWTNLEELRQKHQADIREEEPGLSGIGMKPSFAIGQRALLVETPAGNVLWECIPLLDEEMVRFVRERGGVAAIAVSTRTTTRPWSSGRARSTRRSTCTRRTGAG